jgi:hypothetical protein
VIGIIPWGGLVGVGVTLRGRLSAGAEWIREIAATEHNELFLSLNTGAGMEAMRVIVLATLCRETSRQPGKSLGLSNTGVLKSIILTLLEDALDRSISRKRQIGGEKKRVGVVKLLTGALWPLGNSVGRWGRHYR